MHRRGAILLMTLDAAEVDLHMPCQRLPEAEHPRDGHSVRVVVPMPIARIVDILLIGLDRSLVRDADHGRHVDARPLEYGLLRLCDPEARKTCGKRDASNLLEEHEVVWPVEGCESILGVKHTCLVAHHLSPCTAYEAHPHKAHHWSEVAVILGRGRLILSIL